MKCKIVRCKSECIIRLLPLTETYLGKSVVVDDQVCSHFIKDPAIFCACLVLLHVLTKAVGLLQEGPVQKL